MSIYFSVYYDSIDVADILDIHKYLIKKCYRMFGFIEKNVFPTINKYS